jgi:SsrA-binding protein
MTKNKAQDKFSAQVQIRNKKASFEYEFLDTYTAGIVLTGTEIKSVRMGNVNMSDAYCVLDKGELWVKNLHISRYNEGSYNNHEPLRDRKLLLTAHELRKLENKSKEKGLTIIPVKLFTSARGYAKLEIALARGKKMYDKREDIKERDVKREMQRTKYE